MPDPVYVLERLNWRAAVPRGLWLRLPGADPVRTFHDRSVADAQAHEREWAVRRRTNPFRCGGEYLHYQTSFDAARLYDWFLDHGLEPPEPTTASGSWAEAWERALSQMTDAQRAAAWEVLDRVRFFRVAERPPGRPMHLVAEPHFEADPVYSYARASPEEYVGCTPDTLARQSATADWLCQELYFAAQLMRPALYAHRLPKEVRWTIPDPDPFAAEPPALPGQYEPAVYAEHRPLDLIADRDPIPGHTVYVVLRRHWRLKLDDTDFWRWSPTQTKTCGRPVAAFDTLAAADARMAELEAEARRYPSPFRFGPPHEWGTLHGSGVWGVLDELARVEFTDGADYTAPDRLWARWWDEAVPGLTADEVATAWGLYDRLRFYEVVAVEYRE
jgi:hypothetical protein